MLLITYKLQKSVLYLIKENTKGMNDTKRKGQNDK